MLHRTLMKKCSLVTVSLKRSYPAWLYPGKFGVEPGYEGHREEGVTYDLEPLNPLSVVGTADRFVQSGVSAVVMPWWTAFWAPHLGVISEYLESRGVRVVCLCHNVFDHEPSAWKRGLTELVLSRRKFFLAHSNSDADALRALVPQAEVWMHPHPCYDHFPRAGRRRPRRARLELLFFGMVRDYKGVDVLADAMRLLDGEDVFLTIAGEWWKHVEQLKRRIKGMDRIQVVDRYIPESEVAEFFDRSDVVVLPYRSASGTGVIPLAYRHGKPVIATRVGGLGDAVVTGVSGCLVPPGNPAALAEAIRRFLHEPRDMSRSVRELSDGMTWDSLATCVMKLAGAEVLPEKGGARAPSEKPVRSEGRSYAAAAK